MAPSATQDVPSLFKDRTLSGTSPRKSMSSAAMIMLVLMFVLVAVGVSKMMMNKTVVKDTVTVVGAGMDLPAGSRLTFGSLHYLELPKRYANAEMLTSSEQAVGRVTKYFVPMGEPISNDELFTQKNSLSSNLETHEVAFSLKLDDESMVDHNIACGDRVDVLAIMTKEGKRFTKTVAQDVRVLLANSKEAIESKTLKSNDQSRLTLAVTPDQCELLAEAAESGKIRLALRSKLSRRVTHLPGASEDDLLPPSATLPKKVDTAKLVAAPNLGIPAPPAMPTFALPESGAPSLTIPAPLEWVVEVFSGSHKESYAVPLSRK